MGAKSIKLKIKGENVTFGYRMTAAQVAIVSDDILLLVPDTNEVPDVLRRIGAATKASEVYIEKNLLGLRINKPKHGWSEPNPTATEGEKQPKLAPVKRRPGFTHWQAARA